jgi:hypothetical protein
VDDGDEIFEAAAFGVEDAAAEAGEAVVAAAGVVTVWRGAVAGFLDEVFVHKALEGAVECGGPETDLAVGTFEDFLHDAVTVLVAGGEGKQDVEPVGF